MALASLLLLSLYLVNIHCQTYPYVSFMGHTLANHSYVDLSLVGTGNSSVQCHTDLSTCCSGTQGIHRGDWFFPSGERLPFPANEKPRISLSRQSQRVELRRTTNSTEPTGIYHCTVETDATQNTGMREIVYIGLYTGEEGMSVNQVHPIAQCTQYLTLGAHAQRGLR